MMLMSVRMILSLLLVSAIHFTARAAEPVKQRDVELFAAMEAGEIDAELIAPSPRQIFLRVKNKSTEMLHIQLPKAFAAVPVLAQMQPGIFNGGGVPGGQLGAGLGQGIGQLGLGNQGQGGSQGLGGGFNGGLNGGLNGGGIGQGNQFGNRNGLGNGIGRGAFRVPAGKVGKVSAASFCLEYGKPDPTSNVKYRIVPIKQFIGSDQRIVALCELLADQTISQNVAQAAAWSLANGVSFDHLASLNRVQSKYTGNVRMFNEEELKTALHVVETLNSQTLSSQTLSSQTLSSQTLSSQTLSSQTLSSQTLSSQTLSGQTLAKQAAVDASAESLR